MGERAEVMWGECGIVDELCGKRFSISPMSFYQVNRKMTEKLYNKVKEYAKWLVPELEKEYDVLTQMERQTEHELKDIKDKYPEVVKEESIDKVIEGLRRRKGR